MLDVQRQSSPHRHDGHEQQPRSDAVVGNIVVGSNSGWTTMSSKATRSASVGSEQVGARYRFSISDDATTQTDDSAIVKPASSGGSRTCKKGNRTPAAIGTPMILYRNAHLNERHNVRPSVECSSNATLERARNSYIRLPLIRETVVRARSKAATTPTRSLRIRTMSAASMAISEPRRRGASVRPDVRTTPTESKGETDLSRHR